jgi:hypothetical protein
MSQSVASAFSFLLSLFFLSSSALDVIPPLRDKTLCEIFTISKNSARRGETERQLRGWIRLEGREMILKSESMMFIAFALSNGNDSTQWGRALFH